MHCVVRWVELRSCLCRPHLHRCIGLLRKRMRTFVRHLDFTDTLWHFLTSPIRCVPTPSKCWTCPNTFTTNRGYSLEWPRWGHANTCMKNTPPPHHARNDDDDALIFWIACQLLKWVGWEKMKHMNEFAFLFLEKPFEIKSRWWRWTIAKTFATQSEWINLSLNNIQVSWINIPRMHNQVILQ